MLQANDVTKIYSHNNYHCVFTNDGTEYSARAVLIATGSHYKKLAVPGEEDYIGAGIHFCATCDGPFYKGMPVAVVGGGNSATEESLLLVNYVDHVTLLVRGDVLTASKVIQEKILSHPNISVRFNSEVQEFQGAQSKLKAVIIRDNRTQKTEKITPSGVFIFIGQDPNTAFLKDSGVVLDPWGYIVTGHALVHDGNRPQGFENYDPDILESSVPGIFAAGDVRHHSIKRVASAVGEGAVSVALIHQYLKTV